jgi:nucleoside-diphosphate-sugar epimerase
VALFTQPEQSGCFAKARVAPAALYGVTKLAEEQTALRLGQVYDIDTRAIRMGPVFGPWEYRNGTSH